MFLLLLIIIILVWVYSIKILLFTQCFVWTTVQIGGFGKYYAPVTANCNCINLDGCVIDVLINCACLMVNT